MTEWICVTLWKEAGSGDSGEEGLLLDPAGSGCEHPHLLRVEEDALANSATLWSQVQTAKAGRSMKMAAVF